VDSTIASGDLLDGDVFKSPNFDIPFIGIDGADSRETAIAEDFYLGSFNVTSVTSRLG
jgi:hypothetical protein